MRLTPRWPAPTAPTAPNLTACVDVFAVLALYLLTQLATDGAPAPGEGAPRLPRALGGQAGGEVARLQLSQVDVRLDDEIIVALDGGHVAVADEDEQARIVPLQRALERARLRLALAPRSEGQQARLDAYADTLRVDAEARLPYAVVDQALETAAAAGFTAYRLAVDVGAP